MSGPASDVSAQARVGDISAVVGAMGLSRFALLGFALGSVETITYAGRHPDQVSHLVLMNPFDDGEALYESPSFTTWNGRESLIPEQWDFFVNSAASRATGYDDPELQRSWVRLLKATFTPDVFLAYRTENRRSSAASSLGLIEAPTLVFGSENDFVPLALSRGVAGRIRGARFKLSTQPYGGLPFDLATTDSICDFLRPEGVPRRRPPAASRSVKTAETAVILFTDIVDSTALTERLGDARFRDASRSLDAGLRNAIRDAGGAAIEGKLLGDGVLATFPSAAQAIDGARRCLALSAASELGLHIGLHAGDVIREENNVFGGAVNIASRICGLSAPGEILVSDVVRGMARSSAGVVFEDRGEREMKGVGEAVRVYAVRSA